MGKVQMGAIEGRVPFYRDGDLRVYLPLSGYPGKPLGPAYVLVTRLAPDVAVLSEGGLSATDDFLEISPAQLDSEGRDFRFKYRVRGKPLMEEFSAGGQTYKPEAGRVFLLDLTADPPALSQVQIDVADLLAHPYQDQTLDELKAAVAKLADKDKVVRDFLARVETK